MVSTLPCKAEILRAEQQSYFLGIQFECLMDCSVNWLTLTMRLMLYVAVVFVGEDAMEIFVVVLAAGDEAVVVVGVDLNELYQHLKWVMVKDMVVSVGWVVVWFDDGNPAVCGLLI